MSGKVAKQQRNLEKEKMDDYVKRRDLFSDEIKALSRKHMIDLGAVIRWASEGAMPMIAFIDMKKHYGEVTEEARINNEKAKAEAKAISEDAGKLEV